ncbi:M48 family metallopeptidase [Larkinella rosea]|uniref:Peptidase M48 domain-containing protein n=1 Tax=Larkinella rosea TaxID=2025312 RepID=A0A3P1BHH0_9BACT|nr:M48 family metallopeptidase [Larkinella rosea]RRB00104.1 hypothetical protein EHT25_26130 [Larkinella rosea]
MKMLRYSFLMTLLLLLPAILFAQKREKKKKEEEKPAVVAPQPVVEDKPVDDVPRNKNAKGTIIEFKPPYNHMLVLAEDDEEGRYRHVFLTDSTLFPKHKVSYNKDKRKPVKPKDLISRSFFRAGMEINFHFDHYQSSLRNVAKEIYLDDDYFGNAKVNGILEFRDGNRAVIDGHEVRLDNGAVIKGEEEWKNKTFTTFNQMQLGAELTVRGRRDTTGVIFVKKGTMRPVDITKDDLMMRRAMNRAMVMNKDVLQIGKETSFRFVTDRNIFAYVNDIGQKLIPEYLKSLDIEHPDFINFKFYLVHDDSFNASAYPNGTVIVHTGLLKQLENEAQLAAILGHEIAHVTQRHHTKSYRNGKDWQAFADFSNVALGTQVSSDIPAQVIQAAKDMKYSSYDRNQETQADRIGLQYMFNAGYDPREAAKIWDKLAREEKNDIESPIEAEALQFAMNASSTGEQRADNNDRAKKMAAMGQSMRKQDFALMMFRNVAAKKGESVYASHPRSRDRYNHVNFLLSTAFAFKDFEKLSTGESEFKNIQSKITAPASTPVPTSTPPGSGSNGPKPPKPLKTPKSKPGGKSFVKPK